MKNFKQLTQVLTESASYVGSTTGDKNILTKNGFKNIIADKTLSKEYINRLTEGFSADHREVLGSLMEQTIAQAVLQESYDTLSPFQALSLPLLRVLWPYNSLKDGIQTIVATSPTFLLTAKHYYLVKRDKATGVVTRYELPQHSAMIADEPHGQLAVAEAKVKIVLPDDGESSPTSPTTLPNGALNAVTPVADFKIGSTAVTGLTTDIQVTEIAFGENKIAVPKHGWNTGKNIVIPFNDVLLAEATGQTPGEVRFTGSIILLPSLEAGKVQAILTGAYTSSGTGASTLLGGIHNEDLSIKVKGSVSERWNENHFSFEYQTENFSVTIPDGKRVSSPLPVELVQDIKNLYQLDAASEFGTGMRMLFGDAFDIEGVNFFKETIESAYPGALAIAKEGTPQDATHHIPIKVFNTMPQVGYMGDLVQWRANTMKDLIRMITTTLEKEWYIKYGKVTLFANPIDGDLLHGVDWTFEPGIAAEGEVTADYGVGTFRTAGRMYKLITSQRIEEGVIWVLLTPSEADVMTLRYYPYYFGLETGNGYRDANYSNVPSVTYIRRHKFEKYIPALGALVIHNNNGFPNYAGFNYNTGN